MQTLSLVLMYQGSGVMTILHNRLCKSIQIHRIPHRISAVRNPLRCVMILDSEFHFRPYRGAFRDDAKKKKATANSEAVSAWREPMEPKIWVRRAFWGGLLSGRKILNSVVPL
jgi:hypothetical protein